MHGGALVAMSRRVKRRIYGIATLVIASAYGAANLTLAGCKNASDTDTASLCAAVAPPACVLHDGGIDASFVPCIQDECSLATLNAIITIELQAATEGEANASSPPVKSAAHRMVADFTAQQSNLVALEAQLAIKEAVCDESQRATTDLTADLTQTKGLAGPAFDDAFVRAQVAALTEIKQMINFDLIGCASNGNLKTAIRFDRLRSLDGGTSVTVYDGGTELGVVPDLAALRALLTAGDGGAPLPPTSDAGAADANSND